jgi:hypothetical protein
MEKLNWTWTWSLVGGVLGLVAYVAVCALDRQPPDDELGDDAQAEPGDAPAGPGPAEAFPSIELSPCPSVAAIYPPGAPSLRWVRHSSRPPWPYRPSRS